MSMRSAPGRVPALYEVARLPTNVIPAEAGIHVTFPRGCGF